MTPEAEFVYSMIDIKAARHQLLYFLLVDKKVECPLFLLKYVQGFYSIGGNGVIQDVLMNNLLFWIERQKQYIDASVVEAVLFGGTFLYNVNASNILPLVVKHFFTNVDKLDELKEVEKYSYEINYVLFCCAEAMFRYSSEPRSLHTRNYILEVMPLLIKRIKIVNLNTIEYIFGCQQTHQHQTSNTLFNFLSTHNQSIYETLFLRQVLIDSCKLYYEPIKELLSSFILLDIYNAHIQPLLQPVCIYKKYRQ